MEQRQLHGVTRDLKSLFAADPRPLLLTLHIEYDDGRAWCPKCQPNGAGQHKSPDFSVHRGAIKCFKCGSTWDCFSLAKDLCGVDFVEAQRIVAGAYGLLDAPEAKVKAIAAQAKPAKKRDQRGYATREECINTWLAKHNGWTIWKAWQYADNLWVYPVQNGPEKSYRPARRRSNGEWVLGQPTPGQRPLLRNPSGLPGHLVIVVEGEKCVDAVAWVGLSAVCSIGGASAARMSDWTPLSGRNVLIMPDRDAAGKQYAEDVKHILDGLCARVTVRSPPVPEGDDVADFVERNNHRPKEWLKRMITKG